MSYILDALRRAEAERERGSVPGLHSAGLPVGGAAPVLPARRGLPPAALWLGGALALTLVVALAGAALGAWWAGGAARGAAAQPEVPQAKGTAATAPTLALGDPIRNPLPLTPEVGAGAGTPPLRLPTPPTQATPLAAPAAGAAVPEAAALAAQPPQAPQAAQAAQAAQAPQAAMPAPRASNGPAVPADAAARDGARPGALNPGANAGAAPNATTSVASNLRSIPLAALSASQRAAWPPLVIGGSIYSDSPASRFIIANGQVVREGEAAAPGVVVERIGRSAVVLLWRGLRVEVPV